MNVNTSPSCAPAGDRSWRASGNSASCRRSRAARSPSDRAGESRKMRRLPSTPTTVSFLEAVSSGGDAGPPGSVNSARKRTGPRRAAAGLEQLLHDADPHRHIHVLHKTGNPVLTVAGELGVSDGTGLDVVEAGEGIVAHVVAAVTGVVLESLAERLVDPRLCEFPLKGLAADKALDGGAA